MKAQRFIQSIGIMIALVAGGVVLLSSQTSAHILEHNSSIIFQNKSTLSVGAWVIDNSGAVRDWLSIGVASPGWTIRGIADFNKDQIPDILLQNNETRTLSVWTWDGTKATGWLTIGTPEPDWEVVGVGDFSRDGQADILLYNTSTHAVGAWRMDGSTIAGWIPINEGGPHRAGWTVRGVGDFNGDFIADILWQNDATKALVVWLWNGTQITAARTITTLGADWEIRGIHDFDNDGHQDILLYNSTTRAVVVWRLHENQIIGSMRVKGTIGSDWAIYGVTGSFTPTPVDRALRLTQKVRHMADKAAIPFQGTPLAEVVKEFHRASATCGVQSITLVRLLSEAQLGEAHTSQLAFDPNGFETHVVVEWYNPEQQEWMVLDPTYGVVVTRLRDGKWATIENVKQAVLQQDWASLGYVFLTQWEDSLVRQSYIDYPLNYLSSYGGPAPGNYKLGVGNSVLSYLEAVPFPLNTDQPDFYILRNPAGTQKEVVVDGVHTLVQFNGVDATSRILQKVRSIYPSEDSSSELRLYRVKRFVFPYDNVVAPTHASFLYPTDGARDANPAQPFRWTNVSGALAYYLYVGTTPGAKNVVNTGETQATSYTAPSLPVGQTLYARIHTKLASGWQYSDVTFVAGVPRAYLLSPTDGAQDVNPAQPFRWASVSGALAYYLYVGTTPGAKNVVNTGEIQATSYTAPSLPVGQTLYARIHTKLASGWQYSQVCFTTSALPLARFIDPLDGSTSVTLDRTFRWTAVAGAEAYRLVVGTTPGGFDVLNSGDILDTSYRAPRAMFVFPMQGAKDVDSAQPFRWTSVSGALAYYLYVGTTPGAKDVVDTGAIQATSYTTPSLPVGQTLYARIHTKLASGWQYSDVTFVAGTGSGSSKGTLYARIWTKHGGLWRYFDVGFTQQANVEASQIITPANGSTGFNVGQPFEWTNIPLARGYRLEIGTKPGASNLHDSGEITVTRRLAPNLPIGPRLYGRLSTRVGEQWQATNFTFTVANNTVGADDRITAALWAAGFVRGMADISNLPFAWTPLWNRMYTGGKTVAFCGDYAEILVGILAEVNVGTEARVRQVLFYPNSYDGHILNVIRDESDRWVVIDPTFALAAKRQSDGAWATAEDISEATRLQAWDTISYIPARPEGTFYAENYYIDYPLLFLNVDLTSIAAPALPYLEEVPLPIDGHGFSDIYILQCMNASDQTILLDGMTTTMSCPGPEHLTKAFSAGSIAPLASAGSDFRIYQLRRFVFP